MYEFDEGRWRDETEVNQPRGLAEGWLIQFAADAAPGVFGDREKYLQIGTGQWCAARYATLFPLYSTAVVYAKEFGHVPGKTVRLVRHRF